MQVNPQIQKPKHQQRHDPKPTDQAIAYRDTADKKTMLTVKLKPAISAMLMPIEKIFQDRPLPACWATVQTRAYKI